MSRAILHPTDFSTASRAAFTRAVDLAEREHAPLLVMHVMTPPIPMMGDGYVSPTTWDEIAKSYRKTSQKKLDALVRRARKAGAKARGVLVEGLPAEGILRTASRVRPGMIVVGTHGRTGVKRFFLGSVAGRVVAGAACPVLTVRGRAA
jgi:nucleotide-binding universal stress UspA family protein